MANFVVAKLIERVNAEQMAEVIEELGDVWGKIRGEDSLWLTNGVLRKNSSYDFVLFVSLETRCAGRNGGPCGDVGLHGG